MGLMANVPTLSYVSWKELLITYQNVTYQIENSHTNKPYIYWDSNNPYILTTSNKKLDSRSGLFYLIFNESGKYTVIPNDDIEMNFSENPSRNAITNRIVGLSNETKDKFTTVQIDIDGIKFDVYDTDGKFSKFEQRVDVIDLEVKGVEKIYSNDPQLVEMRENFNEVLLSLQATLGLFSSDMNTYMEDNSLSTDEKNNITAYKISLEEKRIDLNNQLNTVIEYLNGLEGIDQTKIIEVNTSKDELNTAINNLFTNIDTVCTDNIFTNTEVTAIVTYFGKTNLAINECKNTVDYVFLGIGGYLIEEVSNITLEQDNIKLEVKKVENHINTEISRIELEQDNIKLEVKKIENDSITSSELTQTSDSIKMSFLQGGGINKFHNSSFKNGTKYWSTLSWNSNGGSGGGYDFYVLEPPDEWCLPNRNVLVARAINLTTQTGNTLGVGFDSEVIWGGTEWTLECLLACHRASSITIEIVEFDNNGTRLSSQSKTVTVKTGGRDRQNWTKVNYQFTLQNSNCAFICRFFMGAWTGGEPTAYMWIGEPILVSGHHSELLYSTNADEVYEGITKIDMDGITVSNSNANTTTSMTADGFYINQSGSGDIFKVDSDGISLSQGIVTLNKNGLTINSPNYNVQTYIDANGLNVVQNGMSAIKVHSNGLEISQGIVNLNQNGLTINSTSGGVQTVTNGYGYYIYKDGNLVWYVDSNGIHLSQNSVYIDKDRIKFTHSDGTYTEMNADGLVHYQGSNARKYHYLVYGGEYTCYSEETVTIPLPDEFKGKNFSVITAIKRIYAHNNEDITGAKYPLLSFYAESLNKDTSNGTFQVYASIRAWNRTGTSGLGTMIGDGSSGSTESNLLKPVVAYWVFV
jgi:hypothetical protein